MRSHRLLLLLLMVGCASWRPEETIPAPSVPGYRDRTIDLRSEPPVDGVTAQRGDFDIVADRSGFIAFLRDTALVHPRARVVADSVVVGVEQDRTEGRAPILRGPEMHGTRGVEDAVLDTMIQRGEVFIWDRMRRRSVGFVFATGNGVCETDFRHYFWLPDGRHLLEVQSFLSWCPHPS